MRRQLLTINLNHYIFIILIVICQILTSEVPRPRGVSLSRASLYNPEKDFMCFDGSLTIPFSQINDDYCDCLDGSDEPGTSACPNGIFYCTNAGHTPLNLDSSRVNDGVCDCCDGSDEYLNMHLKCTNNCFELGQTAREERQRQAELLKIGSQIRLEFSQKGIQLKQEKKEKLNDLQKQQTEAEYLLNEKEGFKKEAEELEGKFLEHYKKIEEEERKKKEEEELERSRPEMIETFNKYDSNQDGFVDISELQSRATFDRDRNGEVSEDEAKFFLNEETSVDLETFIKSCWVRIKPFLMIEAGTFKPPAGDNGEADQEQTADATEPEHEEVEDLNEKEHPDIDGEDEEEEEEEEPQEEVKPVSANSSPKYDEETQKVVDAANDARKEYYSAKDTVNNIKSEIKDIERYLEIDFGSDDEYAILEGSSFEYTDHEYIYKLYPFNKIIQQPKSSSLETHLGTWSDWIGTQDKYSIMHYTNGHSCWNGPQRSTKVYVTCGSENKVTSVSEPSKCEYQFDFTTPAACKEQTNDSENDVHDEL
ncbi:hypothetical protein RN001_004927 [Aquatica leii]|uniref:Glucosidase 2 subunit beta n=1 Tax=Aquatica leii TaxID=1421715 RepID=A0AAN7SPP8_9COLE|nr:hypothetical protein RN001_004927 [Aquatica leii]